jgi:quercetin dioxygenase-like cupin family protein
MKLAPAAVAALLLLVSGACGGTAAATSDALAQAHLMRMDELAAGQLDALPSGSQFVRVQLFQQPPGAAIASKKHQAGIIYQEAGTQLLQYSGGSQQRIAAGTAVFLQSVLHSHTNDGPATNAWYNVSTWSSAQRGTPLAQVVFETEDIPAAEFPPGGYVESLRRVSLQSGGRSPAHRFSGVEVVFVIDGKLKVKVRGRDAINVEAGQGAYVPANTVTQELAGSGAVTYLAFFVSPEGKAFETLSSTVP